MKKFFSALTVIALTLPMMACSSSGGPSDAAVKEKITEKIERRIDDEAMKKTLQVDYTKCEPHSVEGEYMCVVAISMKVNGNREKEVTRWKFSKANDAWFMKGPLFVSKEQREAAMK